MQKCREREWLEGFYSLPWSNTHLIMIPHSPKSFSVPLSKVELLQCLHSCSSSTHWGKFVFRKTPQSSKSRSEAQCTFFFKIRLKKKLKSAPLEQGNNFCCALFSQSIKTSRRKAALGSEPVQMLRWDIFALLPVENVEKGAVHWLVPLFSS